MHRTRAELWLREELLGPVVRFLSPLLYVVAFLWRRMLFRTRFIAVTGSLGKTTTKEVLAAILASRARTFRSYRNQNAGFMVPLNILRVRPWHRFAVFELSAAEPHCLRRPARLMKPDVALILSVLRTHTSVFRDLDEHAAEKAILLESLRPGGLAVLNGDDPRVAKMADRSRFRVCLVGTSPAFDLWADEISSRWPDRLRLRAHQGERHYLVETQLIGAHWAPSVLAALAAAQSLGVSLRDAGQALRRVEPFDARMQPVKLPSGAIMIRDDYNASIDTIEVSLRTLEEARAQRRVLVITDFSDSGKNRRQRLKFLGAWAGGRVELLVLIGENHDYGRRRAIEAGMAPEATHGFAILEEAAAFLKRELRPGDLVLLKGRTTHHVARLFFAQIGTVHCRKDYCPKSMLCDTCWELGFRREELREAFVQAN